MYINFWYPIGRSEEVTADKPFKATVLGLPFVAFRDSAGKAHVLSDTCVHRGGSLSKGWVKDGAAVCPYHGWQYGGDGKCRKVPSLGDDGKIPARAKVDAYPVQERYGIVFAFLGDLPEEERPPLFDIKEYGDPAWRSQLYILELKTYYERSMENGLDPIHNEFVHPLQGAPKMSLERQRQPLPIEPMPYGSKFFVPMGNKPTNDTALQSVKSGKPVSSAGSGHIGPNQLVTWIQLTEVNAFHQYFFEQPQSGDHTRIFFLNLRNWLLDPAMDARVEDITLRIVHEDIAVLEGLHPTRTPENNTKEILLPGDGAVVRYREIMRDFEARGWKVDRHAMLARQGDVAFAIPCPARRESGNWVLDPVPLLPGKAAAAAPSAIPRSA